MNLPADYNGMLATETQREDTEKDDKKVVGTSWSF
jgi:hypothetical protein